MIRVLRRGRASRYWITMILCRFDPKIMDVIASEKSERDAGGKPRTHFLIPLYHLRKPGPEPMTLSSTLPIAVLSLPS